ncbi:MAG: hypothetical protein HY791_21885 [Deltaproteobacteria bacterium]|nr:hypothetical protein [Deltaproteobacteria bacterium]
MKGNRIRSLGWTVASTAAALAMSACTPSVETIDRTQPNALAKTQFKGLWYYRGTVIEGEPGAAVTEGTSGRFDKIRWEITEELLIGYRSYEFLPYAEGMDDAGRDFFGSPVVAYPILSHFDIQRDYNRTTGIENNVIVENTTDRPWFERKYIRVDWTHNAVGTPTAFLIGWENWPDAWFSGTAIASYYTQPHLDEDPNRPVFTEDYFDITNNYKISPSDYFCYLMLLYNGIPRCGAQDVKVRLSFKRIDATDDYESLYYPDYLELTDNENEKIMLDLDGRPCDATRDPSDCRTASFPMFAAFGDFRVSRIAYDREREFTRTGRIYLAGRFDIWKESYNDVDGALIDPADRTPKPIVYYGTVDFPAEFYPPAQANAASWAKAFNETAAFLQGMKTPDNRGDIDAFKNRYGFDMYQFQVNACNAENLRKYVSDSGELRNDLEAAVAKVAGSVDKLTLANIEKACAVVQATELAAGATLDPKVAARDGKRLAFQWQRLGDLRYNFQNYSHQWLGYGLWGIAQIAADPETGEYVSAQANYFGKTGDVIAQAEVDRVQWLNGQLDDYELLRGDIARNVVTSRRGPKNERIRSSVRELLMKSDADVVAEGGDEMFNNSGSSSENAMKAMFGGTSIERELLVNDEILRGMAGPLYYQPHGAATQAAPGLGQGFGNLTAPVPGEVSDAALAMASPVNWGVGLENNGYWKAFKEMSARSYEMADFWDPITGGMADLHKDSTRDEIFSWLQTEFYAAVEGHEVGHTLALRHNFGASQDPLNYSKEFWDVYWNNEPNPTNPNRGYEHKYSSIMDYGFGASTEGLHGIGAYDEAGIRFIYGQIMDVWNPEKVVMPDSRKFGSFARRCGHDSAGYGFDTMKYFLDYKSIPGLVSVGPENAAAVEDLYKEFVTRLEANAAQAGDDSQCYLFVSDINWLMRELEKLPAKTENIYGARMLATVDELVSQQKSILLNRPEYDDPATNWQQLDDPSTPNCIEGLESSDCADDDQDGVADDKGFGCRPGANGSVEGCYENVLHRVEYEFCPDEYAGYSPGCQPYDTGADFLESTNNFILRYDRDYLFSNFRRDAWSSTGWGSPGAYMSRLEARTLFHMTNVFRYYLYTRRTAFEAPLFEKWAEAAYRGINFLDRIIQTPEPGRYCLDTAKNMYVPDYTVSTCNEPFDVGLGYEQGKFFKTTWTNEYYYKANRVGTFWDKWAAIRQMTSSSGTFIRDFSDLFDRRAFSLGYLRTYEDPIIRRFSGLIRNDHTGYQPAVVTDEDTGEKYVRYAPFFDEERPETGESVRRWLEDAPKIAPSYSWTLQYIALAYAISNFSSINDSAPEFYRFTKIAIKGTPEDVDYPSEVQMFEFVDPETSITYRAPEVPARPRREFISGTPAYERGFEWGIGADILREAQRIKDEEWTPARTSCPDPVAGAESEACQSFERAHRHLQEQIGFIDIVRRFNRRAELP